MPTHDNCPNGKSWTKADKLSGRKHHNYKHEKVTRLPAGDSRGDYHVIERCQYCGKTNEFDCCFA